MDELTDITIIIPSYNRQDYALRALRYWSNKGPVVHLLDGSSAPIEESLLRSLGDNVRYTHMPEGYYERLAAACEMIDTQYSCLQGDDEFFLPTGLRACIKELELDAQLVSCGGRVLAFNNHEEQVIGWPIYPEFAGRRIDASTSEERILQHMGNYTCSTVYAVTRTEVWKKAYQLITSFQYPIFAINELQFELMVAFLGKSKIVPSLTWMRSYEAPPIRNTDPFLMTKNSFNDWWERDGSEVEKDEFLLKLATHLSHGNYKLAVDEARNGFDAYVESTRVLNSVRLSGYIQSSKNSVINLMAALTPRLVKSALRPILIKPRHVVSLESSARLLADGGTVVPFDEVSEVVACVRAFHRGSH